MGADCRARTQTRSQGQVSAASIVLCIETSTTPNGAPFGDYLYNSMRPGNSSCLARADKDSLKQLHKKRAGLAIVYVSEI